MPTSVSEWLDQLCESSMEEREDLTGDEKVCQEKRLAAAILLRASGDMQMYEKIRATPPSL